VVAERKWGWRKPSMGTKYSSSVISGWFEALETPSKELTKWEQSFIESVRDQFERTGRLSDPQLEVLEKIYAEKTD